MPVNSSSAIFDPPTFARNPGVHQVDFQPFPDAA
jgi:hypothetical protein